MRKQPPFIRGLMHSSRALRPGLNRRDAGLSRALQVIDFKGLRSDQKKGIRPGSTENQVFGQGVRAFPTDLSTAFVYEREKRFRARHLMPELKVHPYVLGRSTELAGVSISAVERSALRRAGS